MNTLFKKGLLIALFTATAPAFAQQTIKEKHLANYVMDCLEYWFYPNHTNPQLPGLAKSIVADILNSQNYDYEWSWSSLIYEVVYPVDYVEQIIRGAILQYVMENSYTYAREITSRENARRIADYIYNYLFNYCSQTATLSQGIFSGCIGTDLKNWVIQIYNQSTQGYNPAPVQQYYPSLSCCICLEDFADVPRIFMTPCGHDICVACAERWFFTERKGSCPLCRQTVDKKALRLAINQSVHDSAKYAPSAPPF